VRVYTIVCFSISFFLFSLSLSCRTYTRRTSLSPFLSEPCVCVCGVRACVRVCVLYHRLLLRLFLALDASHLLLMVMCFALHLEQLAFHGLHLFENAL